MPTATQAEPVEFTFGRHETFPFRYGWLQKGVEAARLDPDAFTADDATVRLGVGKNMVRAIRFWCTATKLLEEVPHPETPRLRQLVPTGWANRLLTENGWDRYFEDEGTLWLLQWLLLRPTSVATTWYFFFNAFRTGEFTRDRLVGDLHSYCKVSGAKRLALTTLRRDVDCLVRMYVPRGVTGDGRIPFEDTLDCPLGELGLLACDPSRKHFRLNQGHKRSLPPLILAYAVADFVSRNEAGSASITSLTYDEGSPGRVFALDEHSMESILTDLQGSKDTGFQLSTSAGLRQVYLEEQLRENPIALLDDYYGRA